MEAEEVADEVVGKAGEEFAAAVEEAPFGAVDGDMGLGNGGAIGFGGDQCREIDGFFDAAKEEASGDLGIGRGRESGVFGNLDAVEGERGGREAVGGKEILALEMLDEEGIHRGARNIVASQGVYVDGKAATTKLAVGDFNVSTGEAKSAEVVVEKVAASPADEALGDVDFVKAIENRGRADGAFLDGVTRLNPRFDATVKASGVGQSSLMQFGEGFQGFQSGVAFAVDDEYRIFIGGGIHESLDFFDEDHFVSADVLRTGQMTFRKGVLGENIDQEEVGLAEEREEFGGGDGVFEVHGYFDGKTAPWRVKRRSRSRVC